VIRIILTKQEQEALQLQARREIGRVSERIHFVLLSSQGYTAPQIATIFRYTEDTVRYWLKNYQNQQVAGLYDQPRCGRPAVTLEGPPTAQELEPAMRPPPPKLTRAPRTLVSVPAIQLSGSM
jgi:transposase